MSENCNIVRIAKATAANEALITPVEMRAA